ncbi:MAG TPA: helix-turn-helix domain-containing protein [Bryobacteraceae bacterium]|nr:helix-turn-helix domain-containing protein [Bryobacteraceae bacterium]
MDEQEAKRLSEVVLNSLDDEAETSDLARSAYRSRSQFYRVFQALIDESPGGMRRRLLLERAAWQLGRTRRSITEIALDANFGSLEAFTRAFRKAFHVSPSLYRRMGASNFCLPSPNGIHFAASTSADTPKGANTMDLYDLFSGTETWYTRRLLQHAGNLSDEQLDRAQPTTKKVWGWDKPDGSLREILERMVQTKEVWAAALAGGEAPPIHGQPPSERTPAALLRRFEKAEADFARILGDVHGRNAWSDTFVDALCEPPETFTFGGMFAHVTTFNAVRRFAAMDALQRLGVPIEGTGCPMDYEMHIMPGLGAK